MERIRHDLSLRREIVPHILNNTKTIEVRTSGPKFDRIEVGDSIRFNELSATERVVLRIGKYSSFDDLLVNEDPSAILPDKDPDAILHLLRSIYTKKREVRGVLAFELSPLSS